MSSPTPEAGLWVKMQVTDVIYREDLYPRLNFDEETVNLYRLNLDQLPPIAVAANNILIDGYHRLIAHRIEQRTEINAEVIPITEDKDILKEAIQRNASHGRQLTKEEKKKWARYFYDNEMEVKDIATLLSVDNSTVNRWTTDLKQAKDESQEQKVIDLWLACYTQKQISEDLSISEGKVNKILTNLQTQKYEDLSQKPPEAIKIFNLWQFNQSDDKLNFKGAPAQVVENLLWYYTKPFDVVYDPMAGGGSTIRVCRQMYRRWQASDIAPIINEIKQHDITMGFPDWLTKPDFIYLDPPYWQQADYSEHSTNLANMSLEDYYTMINFIAKESQKILSAGGHIAWVVSATQEAERYIDHAIKFFTIFQKYFTPIIRCDVPFTTQQGGNLVNAAKEKKLILKQTRDLGVFRK